MLTAALASHRSLSSVCGREKAKHNSNYLSEVIDDLCFYPSPLPWAIKSRLKSGELEGS